MWKLFFRNKSVEILNGFIQFVEAVLITALIFGGSLVAFFVASEIIGIVIHQTVNLISSNVADALLYFFRDRGNNPSEFRESYWGRAGFMGMITIISVASGTALYIGIGGWIKRNIQLAKEGVKVKITL